MERAGLDEGERGAAATAAIGMNDATGGAPLCCACRIESVSGSTPGEERKPPIGDEETNGAAAAEAPDAAGNGAEDEEGGFLSPPATSLPPSCGRGVSKAF